jgi:hypothetical protein
MRQGKIATFSRSQDIDDSLSNVPIPDDSTYTTVFKSAVTGYYYERLNTGEIKKITCCVNEGSFSVNLGQLGLNPPVQISPASDFGVATAGYVGVGVYDLAFVGSPFPVGTKVSISQPSPVVGFVTASRLNAQTIRVQSFDNLFAPSDSILTGQTLSVTAVI